MPGLMKPLEYNNMLLVDGDLQKSFPMWKLSDNILKSNNRILEFRLEGYYEENDISGVDYANAVYSCMTACATNFVKSLYEEKDRFDYIVLNTGDIVVVDFNISEDKRNDLIQSGYDQTLNYFKKSLPEKKKRIRDCYDCIKSHLKKLQKYLDLSKFVKIKIEFGDLYIDMFDCSKYLDENDIARITELKNIFYENIKYPPLFGRVKLRNEEYFKAKFTELYQTVCNKTNELSYYIEYVDKL